MIVGAIIALLKGQLKKGPKSLVGNKGYRKYLKVDKNSARIDMDKVNYASRFDGKWVLTTNTSLPAEKIDLKYKELWQVKRIFRDVKTMPHTRPVYHQNRGNQQTLFGQAHVIMEMKGMGRLASYTVITVPPPLMVEEGFDRNTPYCSGVVELVEGPKVIARILGLDLDRPEQIQIGTPLLVEFVEAEHAVRMKTFLAFRAVPR